MAPARTTPGGGSHELVISPISTADYLAAAGRQVDGMVVIHELMLRGINPNDILSRQFARVHGDPE